MNRAVLLLIAVSLAGCEHGSESSAERAPPPALPEGMVQLPEASSRFIAVEPIAERASGVGLRVPAHVAFKDGALSQLGAPLSGRVIAVHVRTGDKVALGAPLVTLDCPEAASMRSGLTTVQASLKEARAALDREKRMLEQGVGIERERLAAETKVAGFEAELQRAQSSFQFVGPGSGTTIVLKAPISGIVISRRATVGAAVAQGGEPVVEVGDPSALWVVADVYERDLHLVKEGSTATIELPSITEPLKGTVDSVGAVVANGMRTAPVRIELAANADLRPGMYGRARIEARSNGLMVPAEAVLIKDGKDTVVYVEKGPRTFTRRAVTVGQPVDGQVQVLTGLAAGERVVVKGALLLDGAAEQLL